MYSGENPLEAQLIITRRCNLTCGYCTEYDNYSPPVPLDTLKERIDAIHRLNTVNISLLGGEPLMHPQLTEIIAYANRQGQVSVTTNGFLVTEELIHKMADAGLSNLEISIDGLSPDKTGYIQKTLRTLSSKLALLKAKATFDVHVNFVLCDRTKADFKATIEEVRKHGFLIAIDLLHDDKGMIQVSGQEYLDLWNHHFDEGTPFTFIEYKYGKALLEGKKPKWKCRAGSRFLYIDEFGMVQYCSATRGQLNKPITEYTREDLEHYHHTYKGCEEGCALLCCYRDSMLDNAPFTTVKGMIKTLSRGGVVRTGNKANQQVGLSPVTASDSGVV